MNPNANIILKRLQVVFLVSIAIVSSCDQNLENEEGPLFEKLSSGTIDFVNNLEEDAEVNPFIYDNIYSGGGVAVGDLNNDGLPDIYFGGNQVADRLYLNKGELKFEDITKSSKILDKGGWTSGVTIVDINNDGWKDIYVCKTLYDDKPELRVNELYINNGDLTFTESAADYGLNDPWRSQQAVFFDYDKDNDLDVLLVNQPPNPGVLSELKGKDWRLPFLSWRLMRNDDGFFNEVTQDAGINDTGYGLSAIATDINNDSWMDLYVTSDYNNPDFLYINQGDGTFKNTIHESMGHISYFSMGVDAADINNDGWSDLVIVDMVAEDNFGLKSNMSGMNPEAFWNTVNQGGHYQYMMNTLQLNQGTNSSEINVFSDIALLNDVAFSDWSWSPIFADFDNDGYKDLYISNGIYRELRNTDAIKALNEKIGALMGSGVSRSEILEKYLPELLEEYPQRKVPNYTFKNVNGIEFVKRHDDWGLAEGRWTTGAAYGDLDRDGDLDLVLNHLNDTSEVYENNASDLIGGNYIQFDLSNPKLNHIGSKIHIRYTDGEESVDQYAEVTLSRGFYSSSDDVVHFGLGNADNVELAEITWPNGKVSSLFEIDANQLVKVDPSNAKQPNNAERKNYLFEEVQSNLKHTEEDFDDFMREVLLPHKLSDYGPQIAISTTNNTKPRVYIPGGSGSTGGVYSLKEQKLLANLSINADYEETGSVFFDADMDGDDDLYVIMGGNELPINDKGYQDKFFVNDNGKFILRENVLPEFKESTLAVIPGDFDGDNDVDLMVSGRLIPGKYPLAPGSRLLENTFSETGKVSFKDITSENAPDLLNTGMINDAIWSDYDNDEDLDLFLVGEWTSIQLLENVDGMFKSVTDTLRLPNLSGWWFHINAMDIDNDGDQDYLVGNLGLNYKYKASEETPFTLYSDDFDKNGQLDIVLSYYDDGKEVPLRGKSCSSQQIPDLKKKIKSYNQFASLTVDQVYGESALKEAKSFRATTFSNIFLENYNGTLKMRELPIEAQIAPLRSSVCYDINKDGLMDIIYAGNLYSAEVETPRADAGMGGVLLNKGNFNFEYLSPQKTNLYLNNNIRDLKLVESEGKIYLIAASNNDRIRMFQLNEYFAQKNL